MLYISYLIAYIFGSYINFALLKISLRAMNPSIIIIVIFSAAFTYWTNMVYLKPFISN